MTVTNRGSKLVWIVAVAVGAAVACVLLRGVRRAGPLPADAIPEPMDPNDSAGHHVSTTASAEATGVAGVLDRATAAGYAVEFEPEPGARLRCGACDAVSAANTFERQWQNRLEGASDPDDMAQVSGLVCPACGVRGTFVSLFGPGAGTDAGDVMIALPPPLGDLPIVAG